MESLSEVSGYLNNLEAMLKDDEFNSIERMKEYKFGMDLVVDEYEGTEEPSVVNYKMTRVVDWLLKQMLKECGDEGVGTWEIIKIGKASRLKSKNKDSKEQNPPPPPPTPT
ncbi:hypothetical protein Tco_1485783 [Tanacetum coccineum]